MGTTPCTCPRPNHARPLKGSRFIAGEQAARSSLQDLQLGQMPYQEAPFHFSYNPASP